MQLAGTLPRLLGHVLLLCLALRLDATVLSDGDASTMWGRCPSRDEGCIAKELQARLSLRQLVTLDTVIRRGGGAPRGALGGDSIARESSIAHHRQRRLLMETSLDPAQKIVSVRSNAPDFHPTVVGGANPEALQPLFQPTLEGYYPYMGYETATPQCKRILNRYFGKCMFGSDNGGNHRFRQVGLGGNTKKGNSLQNLQHGTQGVGLQSQAADKGHTSADSSSNFGSRGGDAAFRKSMDFAEAIVDAGIPDDRR
eukprot:g2973.t1